MRPSSVDQQWPSSSHLQDPVHRSPHLPRNNAMLSAVDASQSSSHRSAGPKPPAHLHTLPDPMPAPYGHRYRSENPHPAPNDDSRPSPVYYQPYPNHRNPPHPYHHYQPIYPPPRLIHDHRPELRHIQTHFPQQLLRQSNHPTHDSHPLSSQSPPDPDPKRSYRVLPHHQSPTYEIPFPHPSQKRPHGSPDPLSHLSPSSSLNPLPHHSSRPSTSSSSHTHQLVSVTMPQKSRHSHPIEPPSIPPDQHPRLYQPQPRRIPHPSPDLQFPSSPRHQNPDPYPSQAPTERLSQPPMPCPPSHPNRSHPQTSPRALSTNEDAHYNSPRLHDQHPLSTQVFPHHRNSHSIEQGDHPHPSTQSRVQSLYLHESPRFQHSSDFLTYDGSASRRHDNVHQERSQQLASSHPSESSSQPTLPEDRMQYLPENVLVQTQTYHPREHLSSPVAIQMHPSYSTSAHRQNLQTHYEQQQDSRRRQTQTKPMESPSRTSYNSVTNSIEKVVDGPSRASFFQDPQAVHRGGLHQPLQDLHDHKTTRPTHHNDPRPHPRPSNFDHIDDSSISKKPSAWPTQISSASQSDLRPSKVLHASNSSQLDIIHDRPSKSRESSQSAQPRPQVLRRASPAHQPSHVSQTRISTDLSRLKSPPIHRTPSPRSYPNGSNQVNRDSAPDHPSPSSSRPPEPRQSASGHGNRETSMAPSCTEDEVLDEGADDGVIRCICSITTDDGFTIQCEMCEVWQHAICVNVPIDEVPEHYFCDQCDPLPERRRQLVQMAPQAERIQRQRLKKEAELRSQERIADRSPSITQGSPHISNQIGPEGQDGSLVDSPAASTSMSRVSSGVCVSESVGLEASVQSPIGHLKGKGKANSSNLDKLQTTLYTDNGLGLSGLQESPTLIANSRPEDLSLIRDPIPRKPARKPAKFNQSKSGFSKASFDPPISCASTSNALESDTILAQSNTDADDRYEAWRYEYTPTHKDIYLDADVKYQVEKLMAQYFQGLCGDENPNGLDTEIPCPEPDHLDRLANQSSKPLLGPTEFGKPPVPTLIRPISPPSNKVDSTVKPQRALPHSFGNTQFLPVTMAELPSPLKLTIKAIPPSAINFFPSLTTNPFCPTFSSSLNNSSTSSLPRLITHGVFSAQPISRGSYIASLKGSITSVKKYTRDVFSQYDTLGCNKPYVKFFKSTRLANCLLRSRELGQIDNGLVIDSRQYGNEMRFIRNGCHPNAFINIIMTPQAPCLQHPEFPKDSHLSRAQATPNRSHPLAHESTNDRHHFPTYRGDSWDSSMDRDLHLPWEVSFGVFAASDISRREEIILPWDWDDQHLVHMLPRLLSHSSTFEFQQQQRSPPVPPVRSQFLPWSMSDLKLLSRKLAAVTLTLFGLMFCGCERKKSCAINLMWKMGCLSAGEPMFPNDKHLSHGVQQTSEILPISSLKERQEMNLPLTFEEKFRLILHSFLEQPNHLTSKVGRNLHSNINVLSTGRQKKHKVDLGPLLGLRRDWWNYSPGEQTHTNASQAVKAIARKPKRPRSRSVFNRNPSINKIRRVSDIGEIRRNGLITPKDNIDGAKFPAAPVTEASTMERNSPRSVAYVEKHTSEAAQPSDQPSQANERNDYLASVSLQESVGIHPESDADGAQPCEAFSLDRRKNDLDHLVESGLEISDNNLIGEGTSRFNVESGQARECDDVSKHEISLRHDEDTSIPAHVSPLDISECADLTNENIKVEDAQPKQVAGEMVSSPTPRQVSLRENSEAESLVEASHQSPRQFQTTAQTSVTTEVRFDTLDPAACGVYEEGELENEVQVAEDQTTGSGCVHEPPSSPSHMHPIQNEKSAEHEIVSTNHVSAQLASVSDTAESLAERRSPGMIFAPSPLESAPLGRAKENCDPAEDLAEIDDRQVSPTSNMKSELIVTQQTNANTPGPSLLATEATHSFHDEHLPIRTAEPSDQSFQSVGTTSAAELSSSHSGFMDVDVYQRGFGMGNEIGNAADQLGQIDEEQKPFDTVPLVELKHSPEVLVAPLESQSPQPRQPHSPSRTSLRFPSVSNESEFEAQDESVLSHPSDASEESLLDSDASTTILGSSDEEMLSSHTPRYLNNRKRIRSKNIIKPLVRVGAVSKNQKLDPSRDERPAGLTTNDMARSSKPVSRSTDKLGNSSAATHRKEDKTCDKASSMSSNLDSEEDICAISSTTAPRESGSKMRLTIRSSSPFDDDAVTPRPQHRPRISSTPPSSSVSSSAQDSPVNTGVPAIKESASPCLISAPIQPVLPPELYPHGASQNATVTRSADDSLVLSKHRSSSDSYPHVAPETDRDERATIARQQQGETRTSLKNTAVAIVPDVIDLKLGSDGLKSTTCITNPSVLESSAPKNSSNTPFDRSNPLQTSPEDNTHPPDHELHQTTAVPPVKQPPKRISLKDYRSRKGVEPVNVTPITNPIVQFSRIRPSQTSCNETSHRKQPPPPIIPALPPLLPPTQQSQPLLPLSPRKLELVASVLKKEDKDRTLMRDGDTGSTPNFFEIRLPPALPPPPNHNDSAPPATVVGQIQQDPFLPAAGQSRTALEFKLPKETDLPDKPCEESGHLSDSGSEDSKASSDGADDEVLEDDIDGVAIESASSPSEDGLEDNGKQQNGLENSKDPSPEEKDTDLLSSSPVETVQASTTDLNVKPPVLEEQLVQMKVDTDCDRLDTPNAELDDPLPPSVVARASSGSHDPSDCSPAPESNHREDSMTLEKNIKPLQNKELDLDDLPDDSAPPRAPPRPRLSLAAYRQRLAAARSSTSEEPHQSQSSSPFLPDLDLMKVTPDPSTSRTPSHQSNPISVKQEQLDAGASQSDGPLPPAITNQAQNPCDTLLTQPLEMGLEPGINDATSTDPAATSEVACELRPSDATMYFPPISPSILMAEEASPRSPELRPSPSPAPVSEVGHGDTQLLPSSSPRFKLGGRTPLESTPVPSTSHLESDVKASPTNRSSIPRAITESSSQPSDIDPKSTGQTPPSRTASSSRMQSASHQPSPTKCTSSISLDRTKSSPSIHACPLPVPIPSYPIVNKPRKLTPSSSVGPSSLHPTPAPPLAPTARIQTPESSSQNTPMDQSIPPQSSSRLLMGSSMQRSPTISLSPQLHHSSISPVSPVPPGASAPRSRPRGSSNLLLGSNRGGHLRVSNRPPHNFNCTSAPSRTSWPPESSTTSNNDNSKSITEALTGSSMTSTTSGVQNTSKNLPEIPSSSSLPVIPNHGIGGIPRNNHPSYHHLPPHRTTPLLPPMRNFPDHRTASMPMMETSGPGPPSSQFRHPPNSNGGAERARYDGLHRTQVSTRSPSPYPPHRGRAKVRGTGQSYWSIDNTSSGGGSSNGRNLGNGPRNDR